MDRTTTTSTTTPGAPPSEPFAIPAPAYLGVAFAPHACIEYPPAGKANGYTVFVDPGHGGANAGAVGASSPGPGVDEATATLAIGLDLLPLLDRAGYRVVLSRTTDTSVAAPGSMAGTNGIHLDNEARVACANAARADLLVGIYMDGFANPSVGGAETIYDGARSFAAQSYRFARLLQGDALASMQAAGWSVPDRGVQTDVGLGSATPGAPPGWNHIFLLGPAFPGWNDHPSGMPGALIEPLFVTNPAEDSIVAGQLGDRSIASGVARAIESFDP